MICIFTKVIIFEQMINVVEMVLLIVYVKVAVLCSVSKSGLFVAVYCCEVLSDDEDDQENERDGGYQPIVIYNSYSTNCKSSLNSSLI